MNYSCACSSLTYLCTAAPPHRRTVALHCRLRAKGLPPVGSGIYKRLPAFHSYIETGKPARGVAVVEAQEAVFYQHHFNISYLSGDAGECLLRCWAYIAAGPSSSVHPPTHHLPARSPCCVLGEYAYRVRVCVCV